MTLTTQIRNKIKQIPEGKTFGYGDLRIVKGDYTTAVKALERLHKEAPINNLQRHFTILNQQFLDS